MPPPDHPADDPDRTRPIDDDRTRSSDPRSFAPEGDDPAARAGLPASIGNYAILGKLGEGGMGVVYEAEQRSPKRKVALKIVRGGRLVTDASIKMFQREAETLGRLKHPGIGAIHEAGRTAEGQHFFAMELVRGATLDEHIRCRGEKLTRSEIRYRLDLFRKICDAVNYAHQRGVIHRDLKPSNIVIGEDGTPKILDFGLARITDTDTEAVSVVTEVGAIKGTLPYMSPEQTLGNPEEIDVRTDVYSLGVIFFQLLSGQRPYDTGKSSIMELMRVIREEPPAPFRTVATVGKLAGGEVETIARKALEKEPDHRYQSAAALSDDIGRYLRDEPIVARPPSLSYLAGKFVRRYRTGVAAAGVLLLAVVAFAVAANVQARSIARARDEAEAQASRAEAMNTFLREMLTSADPWAGGDHEVTVVKTLDVAVSQLEETFAGQPLLASEMREVLGNTYTGIGRGASAEQQLRLALETRTRILGPDHVSVGDLWFDMVKVLRLNAKQDEAIEAAREAARIRTLNHAGPHRDTVNAWIRLAYELCQASRTAEAESLLALSEEMIASLPGDTRKLRVGVFGTRSSIAANRGDLAGEDSLRVRALELVRAATPDDPTIGRNLSDLALGRLRRGEVESARELFREALEVAERVFGKDHPEYAMILENSGQVDFREKRYDAVLEILEEVREIRERNLGETNLDVVRTRLNMAAVANSAGRPAQAFEIYEELIPVLRAARGDSHLDVAAAVRNRANCLRNLGRYADAEVGYSEAVTIYSRLENPAEIARSRLELAVGWKEQGRLSEAERSLRSVFADLHEIYGEGHWLVRRAAGQLVEVYEGLGQPADAEEYRTLTGEPGRT